MSGGPAFGVTFDDVALAEDLAHASAPGRVVALDARRQFAAHGVPAPLLRPCLDEGRDGTRLPGCVKTYLPVPAGDWGMVFEGRLDEHGQPFMHCLAFGRRHPGRAGQPSVYLLADRRLYHP
ncbi:MAG: hypothetical protein ACR2ML_00465 [Solirubrobacteraceae bacterium]